MSYKEILDNVSNIEDLDNTTILKVLEKFSKTIKDFAIEQSGLNNLVNVEFIPSDNNTTYTGDSVDYLGTLKLTLSDNIIVNKSCNIKFNIKSSNTIVVDVDEFNNSLELHLDNSVVTTLGFAESERQKSKNLWNSEDIKIGYDRVTYNKDTNTFTYTVTSAIVGENTEMAILSYGKLKAGNYIVSFTATSSVGNNAPIIVCEIDSNNNFVTSIGTINLIDGYKTIPFSLTEEKRIGLAWYYKAGWIGGDAPAGTKTLTNIQLEEGSVATDYQPYNGAIVHEKDIEPILIYDINTKNTIGGTAYTNGIGDGSAFNYTINNIDLTPYKYMYVYQAMYGETQKIFVDLTKTTEAGSYNGSQTTLSYNIDAIDCSLVKIPTTKNSITFDMRYIRLHDMSIQSTPVNIYRMEGYK